MPFKSARQRRYLFAQKPAMARRWADEEKGRKVNKRAVTRAVLNENFGTPRRAAGTLRRNPVHVMAGGAGAGAAALSAPQVRSRRTPEQRRKDRHAVGATSGALGAQAAWLGTGYKIRAEGHKRERSRPKNMSRSKHEKLMRAHAHSQGLSRNERPTGRKAVNFNRNYPRGLPATKYKRGLGWGMSGKRGVAANLGVVSTGAVAGAKMSERKEPTSKAAPRAIGAKGWRFAEGGPRARPRSRGGAQGQTFRQGEPGYHGPREKKFGPENTERLTNAANVQDRAKKQPLRREMDRLDGKFALGSAAAGAGLGAALPLAATPLARRGLAQSEKDARRKREQLASKAWDPRQAFHAADPGIRHAARGKKGDFDVSSMPPRVTRAERVGRTARKLRLEPVSAGSSIGMMGGMAAGTGVFAAGTHGPKRRATEQQRLLRNERAQARRRESTSKAMYMEERSTNPIAALGTAGGLGLAAAGLGRSGMVGRALGRGVRMAQQSNNVEAMRALQMAQQAQGALRRGTAPSVASARKIRQVDQAVRRVPRGLRGDVAAAAGLLLAGHSGPVRQKHYRPVGPPPMIVRG